MRSSLDIALRRPVARFIILAVVVGVLGIACLAIPFSSEHLPPMFRMLPEAAQRSLVVLVAGILLVSAAALVAVAVRIALSVSYRILVDGQQLEFPLRTGKTKVVLVSDVVSIGPNAAGDHVVILANDERFVLPWYVLPRGKPLRQVAEEIAAVVARTKSTAPAEP